MKPSSFTILQITDLHLFSDPEQTLLGVNTEKSFNAVVEHAHSLFPNPDMICLTGDLSQDETVPAYERIAEKMKLFHCPKYWVPGNHDDTDYIMNVFSKEHIQQQKHIVLEDWQIIMLDTKKVNAVEGYMTDDQFELLEDALGSHPEHHAIIFMHHHALPVGSQWLDNLMLTNAERFWDSIEPYHNIRAVICGHVHQEHEARKGEICFYSTPSTCFQFKRKSQPFGVENLMPGFRVIELFEDGSFNTSVHRVENFALNLDESSDGY